jgi:GDPmannose 4,6-dehydratase
MKVACITGVTGQTGSFLTELLLDKGYKVYGLVRRSSVFNTDRIDHIYNNPALKDRLELVYGDLSDYSSIEKFIQKAQPDEFYHLGAMSHVRVSFDIPVYTTEIVAGGTVRCLEALRQNKPDTKFLHAATSELFGDQPSPQNEQTIITPRSPYACAKAAAYYATINYRLGYDMFAINSISFNHESERRGETFVTRKITRAATRIKLGLQKKLVLGNLDSRRDWNDARDVVRAMHMMMQADKPDDWVVASGTSYSVKDFLEIVFSKLKLDWKDYVEFDERYMRPTEVPDLCGDSSKIRAELGWEPQYSFEDMVQSMIDHDMELAEKEKVYSFHDLFSAVERGEKEGESK